MVAGPDPKSAVDVGVERVTGLGVTALDADEAAPVPKLFVAVTVKVYACPLVNPVMMTGDPRPKAVSPPGEDVTV